MADTSNRGFSDMDKQAQRGDHGSQSGSQQGGQSRSTGSDNQGGMSK